MDKGRERRIKALSLAAPIFDLQASRGHRKGNWLQYDLAELCLVAIDYTVDRMGFDSGTSREALEAVLVNEARQYVSDAPSGEVETVANVVIETLVRPTSAEYSGLDRRRHRYDYSLLIELESGDGVYLRATVQAINFLVSAIDTDIESAQAAAEAQLENLIRRKRIPEAEAVAQTARIRSIQYAEEVRRIITETRRDLRRAGWNERIPARLKEMLSHLQERMDVETRLAGAIRSTRDEAQRDELRAQAARLVETVEDCLTRHMNLHARLMEADRTFFEEHDRQAFVSVLSLRAVDMTEELLLPVLAAPIGQASAVVQAFAERVWGIRRPRIDRYGLLITALLRSPMVSDGKGASVPELEWDETDEFQAFSPEAATAVEEVVAAAAEDPQRLSALLRKARRAGGPGAADYLRLLALGATSPQLTSLQPNSPSLLAAADDGHELQDEEFEGTDLLVGWLEPDPEALATRTVEPAEAGTGVDALQQVLPYPAATGGTGGASRA